MSESRQAVPEKTKIAVLTEAGYRCAVPTCGTILAIDIHHIIEVSKGGGNEIGNLLALCPNCHALFHRGTIHKDAIASYKALVRERNRVGEEYFPKESGAELERKLHALETEAKAPQNPKSVGFEYFASEFQSRSCQIGFLHGDNNRLFVDTGYATYIDENTVITSGVAFDLLNSVLEERQGNPVLLTRADAVSFTVKSRHIWGNHVILKTATPDLSRWRKVEDTQVRESLLKNVQPPVTKVRFRRGPYLGEEVAFFNKPENNSSRRRAGEFQMETARVSFNMKIKDDEIASVALTPIFSRIEHAGAGVFSADGCLVGVVNGLLKVPDETGRRVVVNYFTGVKSLGGIIDK